MKHKIKHTNNGDNTKKNNIKKITNKKVRLELTNSNSQNWCNNQIMLLFD